MRRKEQVGAVIVNGLRAIMTAKEIIQYHKLANTTVYVVKRKFDEFLAAGGSPESFNINRKKHKRRSDCKSAAITEDVRNMGRHAPPPHIFPRGLKVNTDEYLAVMKEVVMPWMDQVAGGCHYVFQQDGAHTHNSGLTQEWLKENLPELWVKEIWPPSSPDCRRWW
jgi:hypothetical protein